MRSTQFIAARRRRSLPVRPKQGPLRRLPGGRVAKVGAGLAVAFLVVLVPAAQTALDPTDTATGTGALASENGGFDNTADGYFALNLNTTASSNTAVGSSALRRNTTGCCNTAAGSKALTFNTTGEGNTAVGSNALVTNIADSNTAVGLAALADNTTGTKNTALGYLAGRPSANPAGTTTGSRNTFVGYQAGAGLPHYENATAIGADARVDKSNALVLGDSAVEVGIGTTTPDSLLQVGGVSSSYGDYLQIPMVTSASPPPASDCSSGHAGRLVLQFEADKLRVTLWVCRPGAVRGVEPPSWIVLAKAG